MIDRRVHAHDAGVRHKAPGRLDADDAGERCGDADRTGLIAAGRHVDFAGGDERARAGRGTARRVAPCAWIVNRPGYAGGRAARKREIFAYRFADDLGAGIEEPRHDRGVELRYQTFEHRRAVCQRHAGNGVSVFDCDLLTGKLAAARAFDVGLHNPGAVFVFVTLRPIIRAAQVFDRRHVIGQRGQQPIAVAKRLDEVDEGFGVVLGHFHAEAVAERAYLIDRWRFKGHRIFPC